MRWRKKAAVVNVFCPSRSVDRSIENDGRNRPTCCWDDYINNNFNEYYKHYEKNYIRKCEVQG